MDKAIKLEAKLPPGDMNGLADPAVVRALMDDPDQLRVGIVLFTLPKSEVDRVADTEIGKARIARFEVVLDNSYGDGDALRRLLSRAHERRTGATTLDTALEDDLRNAFDGISFESEMPPSAADRDDDE